MGVDPPSLLCVSCIRQLEYIKGNVCRKCGRSFSLFPEKYRHGDICSDCVKWERKGTSITKNRSLIIYNEFAKKLIAKYKYRGDVALIKAFEDELRHLVRKEFPNAVFVPIPLSEQRHYERGFNQAEEIARMVGKEIVTCLTRPLHEEKQSKKGRAERMQNQTVFVFDSTFTNQIQEKDVTLVDDIYTTGSTLEAAGKILLDHGARTVSSFTLARG